MFILRRKTSEGNESNTCLGESYNYVSKEFNAHEFNRTYQVFCERNPDEILSEETKKEISESTIYAFVVGENGRGVHPLYRPSAYFVMMSNGKTFDNLSFR